MKGTEFGLYCKKIRKENGDTLTELGKKLGCTASFISAIDLGKKHISTSYLEKFREIYNLDDEVYAKLVDLASLSNNKINIPLKDLSNEKAQLALSFSRKLKKLSDADLNTIKDILER